MLDDIGITFKESAEAQFLADLKDEDPEEHGVTLKSTITQMAAGFRACRFCFGALGAIAPVTRLEWVQLYPALGLSDF
jgi:hypothetical protein